MTKSRRTSSSRSSSTSLDSQQQQMVGNQQAVENLGLDTSQTESSVDANGVLQSRAWFEEQQANGQFADITADQFFQEFLAKNLAYKDPTIQADDPRYDPANNMGYSEYDQQMLASWGYAMPSNDPSNYIHDDSTGLRATRFDPLDPESGLNSQIAFRGTADYGGIRSDTSLQIGGDEYYQNREAIDAMFAGGTGDVGVSGHSLGGAVASIATAHNTEHAGSLTTFQGAGIDAATSLMFQYGNSQKENPIDVAHFQVASDTVHKAGETQIPGNFHETTINGMDHLGDIVTDGSIAEDGLNSHVGFFNYRPEMDANSPRRSLESLYGQENLETNVSDTDSTSFASRHLHEGGRQVLGSVVNPLMDVGETGMNAYNGIKNAYNEGEGFWDTTGGVAWETAKGIGNLGMDVGEAAITAPLQLAKGAGNLALGAGAAAWEGTKWAGGKAMDGLQAVGSGLSSAGSAVMDFFGW